MAMPASNNAISTRKPSRSKPVSITAAVSTTTAMDIHNTWRPCWRNDARVSFPPRRNPTMTRAMFVTSGNHLSLKSGKRLRTEGPIKKPNISSNVTRGSRVRRPSSSVARPRRNKPPRVMRILARSSIGPHEQRPALPSGFGNEFNDQTPNRTARR